MDSFVARLSIGILALGGIFSCISRAGNPSQQEKSLEVTPAQQVIPLAELVKQAITDSAGLTRKIEELSRRTERESLGEGYRELIRGMVSGKFSLKVGDTEIPFVYVPPGTYTLGRSDEEKIQANLKTDGIFANNSNPQTPVSVMEGFFLSLTEISRKQYYSYLLTATEESRKVPTQPFNNNPKAPSGTPNGNAANTISSTLIPTQLIPPAKNNIGKKTEFTPAQGIVVPALDSPPDYRLIPWVSDYQRRPKQQQNSPANNVSWQESSAMANWLARRNNLPVRLPMELEWEYAAKGVGNLKFPRSDGQSYRPAGGTDPLEVGRDPNDISWCGAKDMSGNVSEWCLEENVRDSYLAINKKSQNTGGTHLHYPSKVPLPANSVNSPTSSISRVYRGGAYNVPEVLCESANRNSKMETERLPQLGFRLMIALPQSFPGLEHPGGHPPTTLK